MNEFLKDFIQLSRRLALNKRAGTLLIKITQNIHNYFISFKTTLLHHPVDILFKNKVVVIIIMLKKLVKILMIQLLRLHIK